MNFKALFVLNALIALIFGLAFLFVPSMSLDFFGTEKYESTTLVAQFYGTALLTIGLLLWSVRNVADAVTQRGLGWSMLLGILVGLVVNVIGVTPLSGVLRLNGWITIVIYAVLALLYGFLLFLKPKMKE